MMDTSSAAMAPLLLRNIITTLFTTADKSLHHLADNYKLLQFLRYLLLYSFLFFLNLLPSLSPSLNPTKTTTSTTPTAVSGGAGGDSSIARALSQLLSIVNEVPVSSRKYEVVRSLAERLIDENHREGLETLREVNRKVIATAFLRSLNELEDVVLGDGDGFGSGSESRVDRVWRVVRDVGLGRVRRVEEVKRSGHSAEKLAAELLWLAQKLVACEGCQEAIGMWASSSNLASLALSAEPRVQGYLVKVSAFLFKQVKEAKGEGEDSMKEEERRTKMKMLTSWLPLLCRASNGVDAPVLSCGERAELERVLEETIETLEREEQEEVLSLWLHHFTYCSSSDWPNLHASYSRWCTASRKLMLHQ